MFLDNSTAHPKSISDEVIFLSANTSSIDEGAIKCFKGNYRLKMARYLIKWVAVKSSAVVFYQACQMAISLWNQFEKSIFFTVAFIKQNV